MTHLARRKDFKELVDLSDNINAGKVNTAIANAERFHITPLFPSAMVSAMRLIVATDPQDWIDSTSYKEDDYVVFNDDESVTVWKCLADNSESKPADDNTDWEISELGTYWYNHVRRAMVYKTFSEMLVTHGNEFTQFGLVTPRETESFAVSGSERGGMINLYKNYASTEMNSANKEFADKKGKFDDVTYSNTDVPKPRNTFGITAI